MCVVHGEIKRTKLRIAANAHDIVYFVQKIDSGAKFSDLLVVIDVS